MCISCSLAHPSALHSIWLGILQINEEINEQIIGWVSYSLESWTLYIYIKKTMNWSKTTTTKYRWIVILSHFQNGYHWIYLPLQGKLSPWEEQNRKPLFSCVVFFFSSLNEIDSLPQWNIVWNSFWKEEGKFNTFTHLSAQASSRDRWNQ